MVLDGVRRKPVITRSVNPIRCVMDELCDVRFAIGADGAQDATQSRTQPYIKDATLTQCTPHGPVV